MDKDGLTIRKKMAKISEQMGSVTKDLKVRAGVNFSYNYATLNNILLILKPLLNKYGLIIKHYTDVILNTEDFDLLVTSVVDADAFLQKREEDKFESRVKILSLKRLTELNLEAFREALVRFDSKKTDYKAPKNPYLNKNPLQLYASQLTYFRRYNIISLFNLITEDSDANEFSVDSPKITKNKKQEPKSAPPQPPIPPMPQPPMPQPPIPPIPPIDSYEYNSYARRYK